MKTMRLLAIMVLLGAMACTTIALAQEHPTNSNHAAKSDHPQGTGDILAVAASAGDLTTFVTAVKAAGLVQEFQGKGPFTIFAPSDEAFAKLGEGAVKDLLLPANKAKLAGILANHVVPGMIMAADVKNMKATNINGQDLDITVKDGAIAVGQAHVVKADLGATNGVLYIIDEVLVPAAHAEQPTQNKPKDHPAH